MGWGLGLSRFRVSTKEITLFRGFGKGAVGPWVGEILSVTGSLGDLGFLGAELGFVVLVCRVQAF